MVRKQLSQIANPQTCGLEIFFTFADLPQMWKFADMQFAYPIFCAPITSANPQKYNFSPYKYMFKIV
jgi:hypothetical protein